MTAKVVEETIDPVLSVGEVKDRSILRSYDSTPSQSAQKADSYVIFDENTSDVITNMSDNESKGLDSPLKTKNSSPEIIFENMNKGYESYEPV